MADMLQVIESLRQEEASVQRMFGGEGRRVRDVTSDHRMLLEAADLLLRAEKSQRAAYQLKEAMSTSDFPILFADILDRQMLGYYEETPPTWMSYVRKSTVRDFRNVKRFAADGAEGTLSDVPELDQYPEGAIEESKDEFSIKKVGRRLSLSWEAMINDDFDTFRRFPERLARAARRSESKFATELWVDKAGPHASLYKAGFANLVVDGEGKQPPLSIEALELAFTLLAAMVDKDGEPINVGMVTLVVPPALKVTAMNILNAIQIDTVAKGGTEEQRLRVENWMKNEVKLEVEPYIPHVATEKNGDTMWALFAEPSVGRPAVEIGFLTGYEQPSLYEKAPDARRVGGGGDVNESFDRDDMSWRIRHVFGGTRLVSTGGEKATVASNGSGE